jgi:hypothetical protein
MSPETPAWEISDWSVKLNGKDGKKAMDFCIERVLPRSPNIGLDNHYFPSSEHPSLINTPSRPTRHENLGLNALSAENPTGHHSCWDANKNAVAQQACVKGPGQTHHSS